MLKNNHSDIFLLLNKMEFLIGNQLISKHHIKVLDISLQQMRSACNDEIILYFLMYFIVIIFSLP